jgi:hypothetical protein
LAPDDLPGFNSLSDGHQKEAQCFFGQKALGRNSQKVKATALPAHAPKAKKAKQSARSSEVAHATDLEEDLPLVMGLAKIECECADFFKIKNAHKGENQFAHLPLVTRLRRKS